jgi:PAS domain-containing protein
MGMRRPLTQENRAVLRHFAQILPVVIAFTLMVISSYIFVRNFELKKLRTDVDQAIAYTEHNIISSLLEPETLLTSLSETVRLMMIDGYGSNTVYAYIHNINKYVQTNPYKRMIDVLGFYGIFDSFKDDFFHIYNYAPLSPSSLPPKERPWYTGAIEAEGDIFISQPHIDEDTRVVFMTMSRAIYDDSEKLLGVICIGVRMNRIQEYVVNTKFAEDGFGILLDSNRQLIAHPDHEKLGMAVSEMDYGGIIELEEGLIKTGKITEAEINNHQGVKSILYVQRFYNGWYMGVVTPVHQYYKGIRDLAYILAILGALFAGILSIILVNLAAAKTRMDIYNRSMAHWYKSILDSIDVPITVTNKEGEWTFVNTAVEKFLNINRDDIMGRKCSEWNANICGTENCGITRLKNGYKETFFEQFGGKYQVAVSYLYNEFESKTAILKL